MECKNKLHAVCIPFSFQSHINAMLKLAKLLHSKGFHITFVHTEFHRNEILKSGSSDSLKGLPGFRFETIPDATQDPATLWDSMIKTVLPSTRSLIARLNESAAAAASSWDPFVSCIVVDALISGAAEAGEDFGIPGVALWPMSASVLLSYLHYDEIVENIHLSLKDERKEYLNAPIDFIPGMKDIRLKDLPSFFWDNNEAINKVAIQEIRKISKASAVVLNTFDALETEVLDAITSTLPNIYTIGPMQLLEAQITNSHLRSLKSNLWKEHRDCLKWLDSQKPNSVIYVNFGSTTVMTAHQLNEFAWGLANCRHPFLWGIKPGIVTGDTADVALPAEFSKETAERGMISGWCPQEQVLCHSSVGVFLTHSGWNSTMDTICAGVPVISWPFYADQPTNCRYACVHWGIGSEIDSGVKREVVEGVLRGVMDEEKGRGMKKNAIKWRESARESTKLGGSSSVNLEKIVQVLVQIKLDSRTEHASPVSIK